MQTRKNVRYSLRVTRRRACHRRRLSSPAGAACSGRPQSCAAATRRRLRCRAPSSSASRRRAATAASHSARAPPRRPARKTRRRRSVSARLASDRPSQWQNQAQGSPRLRPSSANRAGKADWPSRPSGPRFRRRVAPHHRLVDEAVALLPPGKQQRMMHRPARVSNRTDNAWKQADVSYWGVHAAYPSSSPATPTPPPSAKTDERLPRYSSV